MVLTSRIASTLLKINLAGRYGAILQKGDLLNSALILVKQGFLLRDVHNRITLSDHARWMMQGRFGKEVLFL